MSRRGAPFPETEMGWDPHFDDGLTRERTLLAWQRTALAFVVNAGVVAKGLQGTDVELGGYLLASVAVVLAAVTYGMGKFRFRYRFWHKRVDRARDRAFRTIATGSCAIGIVGVVFALLG